MEADKPRENHAAESDPYARVEHGLDRVGRALPSCPALDPT
jgi:hypothetical protein